VDSIVGVILRCLREEFGIYARQGHRHRRLRLAAAVCGAASLALAAAACRFPLRFPRRFPLRFPLREPDVALVAGPSSI
jgi:hypothetical protein